MQNSNATKFLRYLIATAVPVISIVLGVPAVVYAQAQGDAICGPSRAASPVAALHGVRTKAPPPVCLPDGKSQEPRKQISILSGPQGEVIDLGEGFIAHDGPFQLGQTGPDGSNMSMPYSAKLTDKLTMVFQQRAALNGNPIPQNKFIYAAPLQSMPAGFQCGVFVIAVSGTATPGDAMGIFCSLPEDSAAIFQELFDRLDRPRPPSHPRSAHRCGRQ